MKLRLALGSAALVLVGAMAAANASAQVFIEAPNAPPPPRFESAPSPRPGFVWDAGHWQWAHGRYIWRRGHWQPVRTGYHWAPGHWDRHGPQWRWIPGQWR